MEPAFTQAFDVCCFLPGKSVMLRLNPGPHIALANTLPKSSTHTFFSSSNLPASWASLTDLLTSFSSLSLCSVSIDFFLVISKSFFFGCSFLLVSCVLPQFSNSGAFS